MATEDNDLALMEVFIYFLEAAPQKIVQLTIMLSWDLNFLCKILVLKNQLVTNYLLLISILYCSSSKLVNNNFINWYGLVYDILSQKNTYCSTWKKKY